MQKQDTDENKTQIKRRITKQIFVGNVPIGGDAPIGVQSMCFSKTSDINATVKQIRALKFAGADIVRLAVPDKESALALSHIKKQVDVPLVADIHFNYKLGVIAAQTVDCIRFNPGNIGSRERVKHIIDACNERKIPVRIGVNCGSLEKKFDLKYGQTSKGMVESAKYNIAYLEDLGFTNLKISLKASDSIKTIQAYEELAPLNNYPFHIGVTEAGTLLNSTVKSSFGLGYLLYKGIGDTIRVSITGELENEIKVAQNILRASGRSKEGLNIISCPTCGRIEYDLVDAIKTIEERTKHIKAPLNISIMGCAVNAIGEAKGADVAIAFGKGNGLIIKKGEIIKKSTGDDLIESFLKEVESLADEYEKIKL
jgi:(E)-4-hydroxy-3-methylbut-2-enyl-diphosphate synthase